MKDKYNRNDYQGRTKKQYKFNSKVIFWSAIISIDILIISWLIRIFNDL